MKSGKQHRTDGIELPNQDKIRYFNMRLADLQRKSFYGNL